MSAEPSKSSTAANLEELLKQGQQAIENAEATKRRISQMLADEPKKNQKEAAAVHCPECYGTAFRPAPVSTGSREFTCMRESCGTQFRIRIDGRGITTIEKLA